MGGEIQHFLAESTIHRHTAKFTRIWTLSRLYIKSVYGFSNLQTNLYIYIYMYISTCDSSLQTVFCPCTSVVERAPHWRQDSRKSLHLLPETKNTSFLTISGLKHRFALQWHLNGSYCGTFVVRLSWRNVTFCILVVLSFYSWLMHLL